MKKYMLGLLLVVAMVMVVSCSQDSLAQDNLVSVRFSKLEARAVDSSYSVSGDVTWGGQNIEVKDVADYFWTYKTTKQNDGFKTGETTGFVNLTSLSEAKKFSAGSWKFELKAYASDADRTAGTQAIFEGDITTNLTADTTLSVPMHFTYVTGTGTAEFKISTTITNPEVETYAITNVEMVIGGKTVDLDITKGTTNWTGSESGIASGRQKVEIKVYVDNETEARVIKEIGTAYIMHGMTTEVTGSASVTIEGDKTFDVTLSPTIPSSALVKAPSNTAVANTLTFGTIPNSENAVSWKVLAVENKKALVISEKALKLMAHTDSATDTYSWANSKIKSWLNDTSENGFISQYGLENVSIATVDSEVGNVFILSSDEATTYSCTADVSYVGDNKEYGCWLRTAGSTDECSAVQVYPNALQILGATGENKANSELGVRPVFWIDIE